MASDFDAHAESEKIVGMFMSGCKELDKNLTIERAECLKQIHDELSSLTPEQMRSTGMVLERRVPPDQTDINVEVDSNARVSGLTFDDPKNWSYKISVPYDHKHSK